jgi:hypothetical protein
MSTSTPRALTEIERAIVKLLVASRTRIAWTMTLIVAALDPLFCLRLWSGTSRSGQMVTLLLCAVTTGVLGLVVWYFGWGLVRKMKQDLAEGMVHRLIGPITSLHSSENHYDETVTVVNFGELQLLTRATIFDGMKEGETVAVDYLPLSKVALAARRPES